jgi:hypothetical protein
MLQEEQLSSQQESHLGNTKVVANEGAEVATDVTNST